MARKSASARVVVKGVGPRPSVEQVTEALAEAVENLGGMPRFVRRGETVVLKPNIARVLEPGNPENTDWRAVEAVVVLGRKARAGRIVIAEGAFALNTPKCFERTGVAEVARRHHVELVDVNEDEFVKVRVRRGTVLKDVEVARTVAEADVLVNLPAFKASVDLSSKLGREYPISMAMKNLKGAISPKDRKRFHDLGYQKAVADLNSVVRSDLVVMSGFRACVSEAWAALQRQPGLPLGLIIVGNDAVAVDAVAATLAGCDPMAVEQIRVAHERGWGCADLSEIDVISDAPIAALRAQIVERIFQARSRMKRKGPLPVVIHEFAACTGCRVALFNAINQTLSKLPARRRLHVILGQHPRRVPRVRRCLYIGNCTARLADDGPHVRGCPPTEPAIRRAILKAFR